MMVFSMSVLRAHVFDQVFHFFRFEFSHPVLMMQRLYLVSFCESKDTARAE